jgi:FkbM family methyltransferase
VDNISFLWQFKDIFIDETYRFNSSRENPIIYDCGANIGVSCLYFKRLFPHSRIKAFEADPDIAVILEKNMFINGFSDIEIINKAVWIQDSTIRFGCQGADAGSIYMETNCREIEAVRLRNLLLQEKEIDLLKIDIEGAEAEVINDCDDALDRVLHLFIEYHSWKKNEQKLDEILRILRIHHFRYHLSSITARKQPFVNTSTEAALDLQANIFAWREK